ncbi:DUF805 domain-containing protein [Salipiger bermudensis]|uniref:DUF805 domain-containing protein n=1 Tax=Salipiger bermudensis TaxID=344736 RepID=UPI00300B87DE
MGFIDAIRNGFSNYATFSGRASRPAYWWWMLFVILASAVLSGIDLAIFGADPETGDVRQRLSGLFQLAVLLPTLGLGFRRLHDTGRPGWYYLLPFLISVALMFVLLSGVMVATGLDMEAGTAPSAGLIVGGLGVMVLWVVQLVIFILLIWWLTRPSEAGENAYGAPPSA